MSQCCESPYRRIFGLFLRAFWIYVKYRVKHSKQYYTRSARLELAEKWKYVTDLFRNSNSYRTMHASHSARMTVYTREEIKKKLETLAQWVACWMYGVSPTISLPGSMPLPDNFTTPQRISILGGLRIAPPNIIRRNLPRQNPTITAIFFRTRTSTDTTSGTESMF